jgi:hypothetical protein
MHTSASVPISAFCLSSVHPVTQLFGENNGMADQLKTAVEQAAREMRAALVYWQTEEFNGTARRLYERVAKRSPFIRYQIEL